jgi:hypothetical protein
MLNRKTIVALVLLAILAFVLFAPQMSFFAQAAGGVQGDGLARPGMTLNAAPVDGSAASSYDVSAAGLIPREVAVTEDFGKFAPDQILQGQNYLDPRSQIGYPETIGGVLRNANQQFRSEPTNPRAPVSIFNLSTIPPDTMRPRFEISPEYA